jgi:hypothetical protein
VPNPPPKRRPPASALKALAKVRAFSPSQAKSVAEMLQKIGIRLDMWRCWRRRYRLIWDEHERQVALYHRRKQLMKQKPFAKAVQAAEKAAKQRGEPPLIPVHGLDPTRREFLRHFERTYDRVQAAAAAGLDWDAIEKELADKDLPLAKHFKRIERRQTIQLRDALRRKVIEEGNAAALNAMVKHNMLVIEDGGRDEQEAVERDADYAAFARERMARLRGLHETGEVN